MAKIIQLPATITREDIKPIYAHKGKANIEACMIDGVLYEAGACVFLGFCGTRPPDGRLHYGVYKLDVDPPQDVERVSFTTIPNLVLPQATITAGPPVTNVVVNGGSTTESEEPDVL